MLPAMAALPAVAIDPATAALATVAADPATAALATVAAEPATAALATVATDPTTAVFAPVDSGWARSLLPLTELATWSAALSGWAEGSEASSSPCSSAST